ncbi:glycerate kinase [Acidovorax sp.]|jgi:hypothetical protein|uniref:glycerate kinase n=1 Tax=Acidovorax sp. TaxID=1872122 RepID=UPI002ACD7B53|nr:glycerate kinase [Acidovorax sp.]MDZ7864781.1 glycerate kinase [Acidovorax sp.]
MNLRNIFVPLAAVGALVFGFVSYGWPGLAAVGGGLLMWLLLHFTRLMNVLKRAADRPIGHVGSAVMLNAKLRAGVNLMHVVAMTRSLGQLLSDDGAQPELYRWTDGSRSSVTCEFKNGKLVKWELVRPVQEEEVPQAVAPVAELPPAP